MTVTAFRLGGRPGKPVLVLGPSLGTTAVTLWSAAAAELADSFDVVGWDLPGHGGNRSAPDAALTIDALAAAVLTAVEQVTGTPGRAFHYAGDSVGGAVGLKLLLDAPGRVATATLLCTGAKIGTPESWRERQQAVADAGTAGLAAGAAQRWFGPGFAEREPARVTALLDALTGTDDAGYAAVCEALATFDVRDRLAGITAPVLAVAGSDDGPTPPSALAEIALGVTQGTFVTLPGVGHLAPVEAPTEVARLIRAHAGGANREDLTVLQARAAGMKVRREVLGTAHVDRATANITDFTREFQEFITDYAWGGIWTRPGLDRRSRSLITLTAMVARGHHEELAMHVRAALTNGLSVEEIKELLLQTAIYCGVPDANTAFRIAQATLSDLGQA